MKARLMGYIAGISLAAAVSGCASVSEEILKHGHRYANLGKQACTTEYGDLTSRVPKELQPGMYGFDLLLDDKDKSIEAALIGNGSDDDSLELKVTRQDPNLASKTNGVYVSRSNIYYDAGAKGQVREAYLEEFDLAPGQKPSFDNANLIRVKSDSKNPRTQSDFEIAANKFLNALKACNR